MEWRRCEAEEVEPPRASMIRQRARYSSSVGGFSIRGRFERLPLFQGSRYLRLTLSWWKVGVAALGELRASRAILQTKFNNRVF